MFESTIIAGRKTEFIGNEIVLSVGRAVLHVISGSNGDERVKFHLANRFSFYSFCEMLVGNMKIMCFMEGFNELRECSSLLKSACDFLNGN